MKISLALAAYIILAGIIYYRERSDMIVLERYFTSNLPVNDNMMKFSFLILFLLLPFIQLFSWFQKLFHKQSDNSFNDDPDVRAFMSEYYPELLEDNVDQLELILDTIEDVEELLHHIEPIFDSGINEITYNRVIDTFAHAEKSIDSNCRINTLYHGKSIPLIFKISLTDASPPKFHLMLYTAPDTLHELTAVIEHITN